MNETGTIDWLVLSESLRDMWCAADWREVWDGCGDRVADSDLNGGPRGMDEGLHSQGKGSLPARGNL